MVASRLSTTTALAVRGASVAAFSLQAVGASSAPSLQDDLSGIFGSISLTAWICLLMPQLLQNYKTQSAEGLSMAFLFVWLGGDITNLTGALFTGLAPTAIALAAYFCVADVVLISQCLYYNAKSARREHALRQGRSRRRSSSTAVAGPSAGAPETDASEDVFEGDDDEDDSPLLARRRSSSTGLPGSHRRRSTRRSESRLDPLRRIITGEDETPDSNPWLHNTLSLAAVWAVGTLGYFASTRMGALEGPADAPGGNDPAALVSKDVYERIGLTLGYASAVCYLCARIPQIIKNYREKSCEGLALLFFLLSLTGNLTYGASLVAYSQDSAYLVKALPWLLGSLGTVAEDMVIFFQFRLYSPQRPAIKSTDASPETSTPGAVYGTV